jgi:hypothetical protein
LRSFAASCTTSSKRFEVGSGSGAEAALLPLRPKNEGSWKLKIWALGQHWSPVTHLADVCRLLEREGPASALVNDMVVQMPMQRMDAKCRNSRVWD